jgi:hypothetical protein
MAKKTVASLQKQGAKNVTKVIKMIRSPKTGAYSFRETVIAAEEVDNWLKEQK